MYETEGGKGEGKGEREREGKGGNGRGREEMVLSRVVSEIFNVENVVTLKSGSEVNQRHRKCYDS